MQNDWHTQFLTVGDMGEPPIAFRQRAIRGTHAHRHAIPVSSPSAVVNIAVGFIVGMLSAKTVVTDRRANKNIYNLFFLIVLSFNMQKYRLIVDLTILFLYFCK